jgi:hypothetical protein
MIVGVFTPATSIGSRFAFHAAASLVRPWGSTLSSIIGMGRFCSGTIPGISKGQIEDHIVLDKPFRVFVNLVVALEQNSVSVS